MTTRLSARACVGELRAGAGARTIAFSVLVCGFVHVVVVVSGCVLWGGCQFSLSVSAQPAAPTTIVSTVAAGWSAGGCCSHRNADLIAPSATEDAIIAAAIRRAGGEVDEAGEAGEAEQDAHEQYLANRKAAAAGKRAATLRAPTQAGSALDARHGAKSAGGAAGSQPPPADAADAAFIANQFERVATWRGHGARQLVFARLVVHKMSREERCRMLEEYYGEDNADD